jgi:alginate O-acetyltransferase complex protein AlgI
LLFNSIAFAFFLPIVFTIYWYVFRHKLKWQNFFLLVSSYFFYGWWSWEFTGLLALSTVLDFLYGFSVASPNRRKAKLFLWLSILNNLGILGIFKYFNFFSTQVQAGFDIIGWHTNPILINVALPIGISFYTFHGMSYVFDIYRGKQKPEKNFVDYAVFVSFFPLLVAGPIERANHLLPQVKLPRIFSYEQAVSGSKLIIWGLFKKIVIADSIAPLVDMAFENPESYSTLSLLIAAIGFALQIYSDFSGYSDIASGTAKLFGFELLKNFNLPYLSRSIPEFWRRWHISLSSWFRDYLYIPLGGSKSGPLTSIRNVFIIFLVSGMWHGANWTFIFWGLLHALFFLPSFLLRTNRNYTSSQDYAELKDLPKILATFIIVTTAWIFFRAESITDAYVYLVNFSKLTYNLDLFTSMTHSVMFIKFCVGSIFMIFVEWRYLRVGLTLNYPTVMTAIFMTVFLGSFRNAVSFIYFQF